MFQTIKLEKSYRKLLLAGVINGIGDRFSQVALLSFLLAITGSGLSVGITMALRMIPFLLFGSFSSLLANKWSRKALLITTDLSRGIIATSFLFVHSANDLWIVYIGSFLLASGEALYGPARKASIPAVVEPVRLKEVNSWEQVSLGFVLIIGALSGGLVSYIFGPKSAFLINILSFIVAGFIIRTIPTLEGNTDAVVKGTSNKNGIFSIILTSSFIIMLLSLDILNPIANGIENILLSVYAVKTFHMGEIGVGILYSVLGSGLIISPLFSKLINRNLLPSAFLCLLMEGVILTGISRTNSFALVVCMFGILTIFGGVGNTLFDTAVMQTIPSKWHSMFFSFSAVVANTSLGASMFMTGYLLEFISPRMMGLIGGLTYIVIGIVYYIFSRKINLQKEQNILVQFGTSH
ncbi:MAG: MFS transporter [Bacillota bacterium]|nr:MFS transporter [Bacillota bacterium]